MSKIAVVFWSGTGNTEAMANAVAEAAKNAGADVSIFASGSYDSFSPSDFDAIAFGCPAMGAEVLEEDEFQPMYDSIKNNLSGKKVALFGSYGWGDGEWMRDWEEDIKSVGAVLATESVMANEAPDDEALAACAALAEALL